MEFGIGLMLALGVLSAPALAVFAGYKLQSILRSGAFLACTALFGTGCFLAGAGSVYFTQPPQGPYQTHYANRDLMTAIAFINAYQAREGRLPTASVFAQHWTDIYGNKGIDYAPSYPGQETPDGSDKTYRVGVWEGDDFLYYDSAQSVFYYGKNDPKGTP